MNKKVDLPSLRYVQGWLKEKFDIDAYITEYQYDRVDLWYEKEGEKKYIEVKRRSIPASRYDDAVLDYGKYVELLRQKATLVYLYTDCVYVGDYKRLYRSYAGVEEHRCERTTMFEDHSMTDKMFVHFWRKGGLRYE